jgi:hypothetical protein
MHRQAMIAFDPDSDNLPARTELPKVPGAPEGALWFWGEHDEVCADTLVGN